jgi:hypothetical protein
VATQPNYSKHLPEGAYDSKWWFANWETVKERDATYVKIDDDMVFIEDDTVAHIVKRLVDNTRYFAVSANVVNNPALSWVHNRLGVYEPYWPVGTPITPNQIRGDNHTGPVVADPAADPKMAQV